MRKAKRLPALIALVMISAVAVGCTNDNSDSIDRKATDKAARRFSVAQSMHQYQDSQARRNLIAAQDALALGADSWLIITVPDFGITFECASVGSPIPFGTQVSNPEKAVIPHGLTDSEDGPVTLAQEEPYGLYPPANVRGTLINCILPKGEVGIGFSESDVTAFMFDVNWNPGTGKFELSQQVKSVASIPRVDPKMVNPQPAVTKPTN